MFLNSAYNQVIFEHKNKEYGAFEIRNSYNKNKIIASIITIFISLILSIFLFIFYNYYVKNETIYEEIDYRSIIYSADEVLIPNIIAPEKNAPKEIVKETKEDLPPVVKKDEIKKNITTVKTEVISEKADEKTNTSTNETEGNGKGKNKAEDLKSVSNDTTGNALYTNEIFMKVDQGAEFQGGKEAFATYLKKSIVYPEYAKENKVNGIIFIHLVINRDGTLQDFKLYKGIEKSCNEEVLRVIQAMPNWVPARKNGINVRQRLIIPINFNALN
ncbi:MAG: energy transducer TonB [Cytophagales bacterium]|nr:MAG: energy transducer TonB [Cytophagales bacterium]